MGVITHANPEPAVRERVPAELPRLLYILRALAGAGWAIMWSGYGLAVTHSKLQLRRCKRPIRMQSG